LAKVVRDCQELPGQRLFGYVDDDGNVQAVDSDDVNEYLRAAMGDDFSAKDFRTWAGTVLAARALRDLDATDKSVKQAIEQVASELGNTPAVCRRCYVHPAIIDSHLDGSLSRSLAGKVDEKLSRDRGLSNEERLVLTVLRRRLPARPRAARAA
jgi:DNA topoisomerase-1